MPEFEIRIPTYRRPALLERALHSVQTQTERDWVAIVYDDSPAREAESVVLALQDERIWYRPNPRNYGAAKNIDQVFRKQPATAAKYFATLGDDNLLLPHFLQRGREVLAASGCKIAMLNQNILDQHGNPVPGSAATTRGDWFRGGVLQPAEIYASLFFNEGISDGGLFWSRAASTDFEVGPDMTEVCLQESCRTLKVSEPLFFDPNPSAVHTVLPGELVVRQTAGNRTVSRGRNEIVRYLLRRGGRPIKTLAVELAGRINRLEALHRNAEQATYPWEQGTIGTRDWKLRGKALVRWCITRNPVADFLALKPGIF